MSEVYTMTSTLGDVLKREWDPNYSREWVTLAASVGALAQGAVLGKVTADGKYKPSPATGTTGEEVACAVLLEAAPASGSDQTVLVLSRGPAIVSDAGLSYDSSVDDAVKKTAKHAELAAYGIVVRQGV